MGKAILLSIIFHILLFAGVIWSTKLSLLVIQQRSKKIELVGELKVTKLYKPTFTPMKKGEIKRELPPPKVKKKLPPPKPKAPVSKLPEPKPEKPKPAVKEKKQDFKSIFDKMRQDSGLDKKKPPREENFPTSEEGKKEGDGTGGTASLQASPAQLALQRAMLKHYEFPLASKFREENPDVAGYINVRVIGTGNKLQIVTLSMLQSTGFPILDRSCEAAVRKALEEEIFASDIISELSGKGNTIVCKP